MKMTNNEPEAPVGNPNPRNNTTMFKIFQNVQFNVVTHKKYIKEMKKLYKAMEHDSFRESFKNALFYLFTFGESSPNIDRIIQFVASFCTSLNDDEQFLMFIFEIIFQCQCGVNQAVRFRSSHLLQAVLAALGEDASLDDDLCDKLLTSQIERMNDTRSAVRCRAALALQRLQDPSDPDDQVTKSYRFHMSCDPSASVRRAIIMSIAKCQPNYPFVLERLCDVDDGVRRAAFLYMSAINVSQLRVKQRLFILKVGLNERCPRVRRVVEEIVIPSWLSTFKGNIIELLKAIRLDNAKDAQDSQYVAGKLLESLFKRLSTSDLLEWLPVDKNIRVIAAEKLNKETMWYWRHLAEHLRSIDDLLTFESVFPELVVLTGYIEAIVKSPCPSESENPVGFHTRQHVLQELATMLRVYDASDVAGRNALQTLVYDTLTGDHGPLNGDVIRAFVLALELSIPEVTPRIELLCRIVSELREPLEEVETPAPVASLETRDLKIQRAELRVQLNVAMEDQEDAVREQNYALAAECKAKVKHIQEQLEELNRQAQVPAPAPATETKEKNIDSSVLNKCLVILNSAMDSPQVNTVFLALQLIFDEIESEIFQNPETVVNALETITLFGMLDKKYIHKYKSHFFAHLIDTSNESAKETALKCIVDLLCVHGVKVFEAEEQAEKPTEKKRTSKYIEDDDDSGTLSDSVVCQSISQSHGTLIELLLSILDHDDSTYRLIVVQGLCRLIYLGYLESPAVLSRLLLLWFNPATLEEDMLRQIIGIFFVSLPISLDGAQEQIQKATLPTLRALANAPTQSPIAEIDQEEVVKFLVSLTKVNHEPIDSQGAMAMMLVNYLSRKPACPEVGLVCRMLALLSPPRDVSIASDLIKILRELVAKLPDKQSCRNLTRYLGNLEAAERLSLNNKMSTGTTEATLQNEDSINTIGRTTASLPVPLAWSTHVVINDVVPEDGESDASTAQSTTEMSKAEKGRSSSERKSMPSDTDSFASKGSEIENDSNIQGVPTVKKAKVTKGDKGRSSLEHKSMPSDTDSVASKSSEIENSQDAKKKVKVTKGKKKTAAQTRKDIESEEQTKNTKPAKEKKQNKNSEKKRTRSQSSIDDFERGKKKIENKPNKGQEQSQPSDNSEASSQGVPSTSSGSGSSGKGKRKGRKPKDNKADPEEPPRRLTRSSTGSRSSASFAPNSSGDETELHTIVYESDVQQEIFDDSSELMKSRGSLKGNVTIPETPEGSEESDSEPEVAKKGKGKNK